MQVIQLRLLYIIIAIAIIGVFFLDPIQQDPKYHNFADQIYFFSISNFWNVVSNLPFVFIGIAGLFQSQTQIKSEELKSNYTWFFIGIILTGFGSGYYHYNPNNSTLIWDRLPMTIAFMSFLSIIIGEFISLKRGQQLLYFFLFIGCLSIIYWVFFEDLRMYALVQFLPLFLIPIILFLSKNHQKFKKYFWLMLTAYLLAKVLENKDFEIFKATSNIISGHTLKHFAAAIGPVVFYKFIQLRFQSK